MTTVDHIFRKDPDTCGCPADARRLQRCIEHLATTNEPLVLLATSAVMHSRVVLSMSVQNKFADNFPSLFRAKSLQSSTPVQLQCLNMLVSGLDLHQNV